MNAPPSGPPVPPPPPEIEAELEAASAAGDDTRFNIAKARYKAWLRDNGWADGPHGTNRPDGSIR